MTSLKLTEGHLCPGLLSPLMLQLFLTQSCFSHESCCQGLIQKRFHFYSRPIFKSQWKRKVFFVNTSKTSGFMIWGVVVAVHLKGWIVKIQESLDFPCAYIYESCPRDKCGPYQEASCLKGELSQRGLGTVEPKAQWQAVGLQATLLYWWYCLNYSQGPGTSTFTVLWQNMGTESIALLPGSAS